MCFSEKAPAGVARIIISLYPCENVLQWTFWYLLVNLLNVGKDCMRAYELYQVLN